MKPFLTAVCTALVLFGIVSRAEAKKPEDQEFRHVIITLNSGEKVDGYIHRNWEVNAYSMKKANYSLKIVPSPDAKGDEATKYTADDIDNIVFVEASEAEPAGMRWESHDLIQPNLKDRYHTTKMLMIVEKEGDNATLYRWRGYASVSLPNGRQRTYIATYRGVRFHDQERNNIVYYIMKDKALEMQILKALFKRDQPELEQKITEYFYKGKEKKAHAKELVEDPTLFLRVYDEYLSEKQ